MNRAEKRRLLRKIGQHRSTSKKGHKPALRAPNPASREFEATLPSPVLPQDQFPALERSGFVIPNREVKIPGVDTQPK